MDWVGAERVYSPCTIRGIESWSPALPLIGNGPFRSSLKAAALVASFALTARLLHLGLATTRQLLLLACGLGLGTLVLGALALAGGREARWEARLFAPGRAHFREMLHVLSFFTFTDPGEVNWHAVDQWEGRRAPRRIGTTVKLYVAFVLPTCLVLDLLLAEGQPRLTVAAAIYLVPWTTIRHLEERGRLAAASEP